MNANDAVSLVTVDPSVGDGLTTVMAGRLPGPAEARAATEPTATAATAPRSNTFLVTERIALLSLVTRASPRSRWHGAGPSSEDASSTGGFDARRGLAAATSIWPRSRGHAPRHPPTAGRPFHPD